MNTKVKTRTWIALLNLLFLFTAMRSLFVSTCMKDGISGRRGALTGMKPLFLEQFIQT